MQLLKGPNGVGRYDRLCQSMSASEASARIRNGEPHVIRLKIPLNERITFDDTVYGRLSVSSAELDDAVLMKSDGFPTYHFANVIDDHLMRISTVVRGQEWIASTPLHLLIYRAFNWQAPAFAHLPLLINPDGSKLSKRQNAAHVQTYISDGFLPAALVNFVAFLGWTPSDSRREVLSMPELIQEFSLQRINQSDSTVNFDKLRWLNRQHLRQSCNEEAVIYELRKLLPNNQHFTDDYLKRVLICASERCALLPEIPLLCQYFFQKPNYANSDAQLLLAKLKPNQLSTLQSHSFPQLIKEQPMLMRLVLTGSRVGAPVDQIAAVLGEEECHARISQFKQSIATQLPRQNQN